MTYDVGGYSPPPPPPPAPVPPAPPAPSAPPQPPGRPRWHRRAWNGLQAWPTSARIVTGSLAGLLVLALIAIPFVGDDGPTTETAGDVSTARARPTITRPTPTTHRTSTTIERTTTTTRPPDEPETLPIGQTLDMVVTDFDGGETFVDVTVANPATFTEEPVDYGSTPQNGLYLVVDVTVVVTEGSEGTYPVNESDFKFVAADGSVAETTIAMGFDPMLQYTELSAGQRAAGTIVFDIAPAQQPGAKIQINDIGDDYGEPFAYWSL